MMEPTEAIKLSKQEALSIFCFLEVGYSSVLEEKMKQVKNNPNAQKVYDIKLLVYIVSVLKCYKSVRISEIVQDALSLIINDLYVRKSVYEVDELKFLFRFVFQFRNVKNKKEMPNIIDNEYVAAFQKQYRGFVFG